MKKPLSFLLICAMLLGLTACGNGGTQLPADSVTPDNPPVNSEPADSINSDAEPSETPNSTEEPELGDEPKSRALVAFFSLPGEQYEVGVVEKGNTQIIAEMIAEQTGADSFQIQATTEYPTTYDALLDVSRQENENPPSISEQLRFCRKNRDPVLYPCRQWPFRDTAVRCGSLSGRAGAGWSCGARPYCTERAGHGLGSCDRLAASSGLLRRRR